LTWWRPSRHVSTTCDPLTSLSHCILLPIFLAHDAFDTARHVHRVVTRRCGEIAVERFSASERMQSRSIRYYAACCADQGVVSLFKPSAWQSLRCSETTFNTIRGLQRYAMADELIVLSFSSCFEGFWNDIEIVTLSGCFFNNLLGSCCRISRSSICSRTSPCSLPSCEDALGFQSERIQL
jgi:hypothetical protein